MDLIAVSTRLEASTLCADGGFLAGCEIFGRWAVEQHRTVFVETRVGKVFVLREFVAINVEEIVADKGDLVEYC